MADNFQNAASKGEARHEPLDLAGIWRALVRNRFLIAGTLAAFALAAVVVTAFQPRRYLGETTLRIDEEGPGINLVGERLASMGLGQLSGMAGGNIRTDMAVLQSRRVAETVADSLDLHVQLLSPDTARSAVLRVLSAPRNARPLELELRREGEAFRVSAEPALAGVPATVRPGETFRAGDVTLVLAAGAAAHDEIGVRVESFRGAVGRARKMLRVGRPDPTAQVLMVQFESGDPEMAAAVPNLITRSFIDFKRETSQDKSRTSLDFLREQAGTYEARLRDAEGRLQAFREQGEIVEPKVQATEQVKRLAQLQSERDALVAERGSLAALLQRVSATRPATTGPSPYREIASFPSLMANGAVQSILNSLAALETERSQLLVRRTEQNLDVQGVNRRIAEVEGQLHDLARNYLAGLNSNIASLDGVLGGFSSELARIPAQETGLLRLAREQKLLEQVATLIETKLKEAEIQSTADPDNVRILDAALVPEHPSSPRPLINLLVALVVGTVVGVGVALLRELLDGRVHDRADLETVTAGVPVLGIIPRVRVQPGAAGRQRIRIPAFAGSALPVRHPLVTRIDPENPAAAAYRLLQANVMLGSDQPQPRVMVVTSPGAEDGKSTGAANLAVTLAQHGNRTLLVDADLRLGLQHTLFGVKGGVGLSDVLRGEARAADVVQHVVAGEGGGSLHLLPRGSNTSASSELLGSTQARELLDELRRGYDVVVIDAPPINLMPDAGVLGKMADTTLVMARVGSTDRQELSDALDRLRYLRAPVSGVVLNGADPRDSPAAYRETRRGQHARAEGIPSMV